MSDWRYILDQCNIEAKCAKCTDSTFASLSWSFNIHFNIFHSHVESGFSGSFHTCLSSEWSAFLGTFKSKSARRALRNNSAVHVSEGNDGVIERSCDMHLTLFNFLFLTFVFLLVFVFAIIYLLFTFLSTTANNFLWTFSCACVVLCALTTNRKSLTMTNTTIATDFVEFLDIHTNF